MYTCYMLLLQHIVCRQEHRYTSIPHAQIHVYLHKYSYHSDIITRNNLVEQHWGLYSWEPQCLESKHMGSHFLDQLPVTGRSMSQSAWRRVVRDNKNLGVSLQKKFGTKTFDKINKKTFDSVYKITFEGRTAVGSTSHKQVQLWRGM